MKILNGFDKYKEGTRVLLLRGRHKDGVEKQRSVTRITHRSIDFDRTIRELIAMSLPGERIYGSLSPRSVVKASKLFRQRQLDSEYEVGPGAPDFYENLESRWASCLMARTSVEPEDKLWLIDIDTPEELVSI